MRESEKEVYGNLKSDSAPISALSQACEKWYGLGERRRRRSMSFLNDNACGSTPAAAASFSLDNR